MSCEDLPGSSEIGPITEADIPKILCHLKRNEELILDAFLTKDEDALRRIAKQLVTLGVRLKRQ